MLTQEEERQRLIDQITDWNDNRLDLFEISLPNEHLEFHGVIRFFFQGDDGRFQSKCVRVSSTASSRELIEVLIEKFHPDMRMLGRDRYGIYENHTSAMDRRLNDNELPLLVQLYWAKDDREGKFILKNESRRPVSEMNNNRLSTGKDLDAETGEGHGGFKRRWSSKKKKKRKEEAAAAVETGPPEDPSRPPESSFTRTISNPDEVMRRKRQQKLEARLQQFSTHDGNTETGGTLKIYGDTLNSDVPYKTLLLSVNDTAAFVVKETLDKYSLEQANPAEFCLVQVNLPPRGERPAAGEEREIILRDDDCPLGILVNCPPTRGNVIFQIRKRPPGVPTGSAHSQGRLLPGATPGPAANQRGDAQPMKSDFPREVPYLSALNPDGSERRQAGIIRLTGLNNSRAIKLGSGVGPPPNISLHPDAYPGIRPLHCHISSPTGSSGSVVVTPALDASSHPPGPCPVWVNNARITGPTPLQSGVILRLGRDVLFRFIDPAAEQKYMNQQKEQTAVQQRQVQPINDLLPISLDYRPDKEIRLLDLIISQAPAPQLDPNGPVAPSMRFKLAPAYALYLVVRACVRDVERPDVNPAEREHRLVGLVNQLANKIYQVVQRDRHQSESECYWLGNASEVLHFLKHDEGVRTGVAGVQAQDTLAGAVQHSFDFLYAALADRMCADMPAFLSQTEEDLEEDMNEDDTPLDLNTPPGTSPRMHNLLRTLSTAMTLLRRCRVNAALTIQLFSRLFHLINMWLFNRLVGRGGQALLSTQWGDRLYRRLDRVRGWAERQGLELAAECHLQRITQACRLLLEDKTDMEQLYQACMELLRLNSLQLKYVLENVQDYRLPEQWIEIVVSGARELSDRALMEENPELKLEEDEDLHLPLLLPADGYSCDIPIEGIPPGLTDYLLPLQQQSLLTFKSNPRAEGTWTAYLYPYENTTPTPSGPGSKSGTLTNSEPPRHVPPEQPMRGQEDDIQVLRLAKVNNSLGLSIVAAKGENRDAYGIYIKEVVPGGAAAQDGRLEQGDQLVEVEGTSLVNVTQEDAARTMGRTPQVVTLHVDKGAAHRHNLFHLIAQHSNQAQNKPLPPQPQQQPMMNRQGPNAYPAEPPHMQIPPQQQQQTLNRQGPNAYPGEPPNKQSPPQQERQSLNRQGPNAYPVEPPNKQNPPQQQQPLNRQGPNAYPVEPPNKQNPPQQERQTLDRQGLNTYPSEPLNRQPRQSPPQQQRQQPTIIRQGLPREDSSQRQDTLQRPEHQVANRRQETLPRPGQQGPESRREESPQDTLTRSTQQQPTVHLYQKRTTQPSSLQQPAVNYQKKPSYAQGGQMAPSHYQKKPSYGGPQQMPARQSQQPVPSTNETEGQMTPSRSETAVNILGVKPPSQNFNKPVGRQMGAYRGGPNRIQPSELSRSTPALNQAGSTVATDEKWTGEGDYDMPEEDRNPPWSNQKQPNQYPPMRDAEPSRQPMKDAEPSRQPMRDAEPSRQPVREAEYGRQPIRDIDSIRQPMRGVDSGRQPMREVDPARQPMREVDPARQPMREVDQARQPIREVDQARQPMREVDPARQPMREANPVRQPIKEASGRGLTDYTEMHHTYTNLPPKKELERPTDRGDYVSQQTNNSAVFQGHDRKTNGSNALTVQSKMRMESVWTETDIDRNRMTRHGSFPKLLDDDQSEDGRELLETDVDRASSGPGTPLEQQQTVNLNKTPDVRLLAPPGGANDLPQARMGSPQQPPSTYQPPYERLPPPKRDSGPISPSLASRVPGEAVKSQPQRSGMTQPRNDAVPRQNVDPTSGRYFQAEVRSLHHDADSSQPVRATYVPGDRSPSPELPPPPPGLHQLGATSLAGKSAYDSSLGFEEPSPPLPPPPTSLAYQQPPSRHGTLRTNEEPPPPEPTASYPQYHPPTSLQLNQSPTDTSPSWSLGSAPMPPPPPISSKPGRYGNQTQPEISALEDQLRGLESRPGHLLTPMQREQMQRLRVEVDFRRRLAEEAARASDEEDHSTAMRLDTSAKGIHEDGQARVAMIRSMRESLERSQEQRHAQEDETRQRMRQSELEAQERQQRKLEEFEREREEERVRTQRRAEQRAREHEEWLRRQQGLRDAQRQAEVDREKEIRRQEEEKRQALQHRPPVQQTMTADWRPRYGRPRFDPGSSSNTELTTSGPIAEVESSLHYQPPGGVTGKKSVSFDANLATVSVYSAGNTPRESYSEEAMEVAMREQSGHMGLRPISAISGPPPPPVKPKPRPASAYSLTTNETPPRAPSPEAAANQYMPAVIGKQEVYRDLYNTRRQNDDIVTSSEGVENLPFREKMRLFASSAGDGTPKDRVKTSSRQRLLEQS